MDPPSGKSWGVFGVGTYINDLGVLSNFDTYEELPSSSAFGHVGVIHDVPLSDLTDAGAW